MKRNFLFVFTFAFLLIGCSNDDSNVITPNEEGVEENPAEAEPPVEEETSVEEEIPTVDCDAPVSAYDAKPSDFELLSTVDDKFIRNNTDQVQAALDSCGEGGVVWLEDKVWLIDRDLIPKFNNTKIVGGTLKRADAKTSVLTEAVKVGDSVLTVENSDNFFPGLILSVTDGDQYEDAMYPQVFVATVEGGKVTLGSGVTKDFDPGAVVFNVATLVKINNNTVDGTVISNVIFDGNEANNNQTYDWRFNSAIGLTGKDQFIECSQFINSPCESIIGHNLTVRNTSGENLYGSFFHASGFEIGAILLENCTTNDTNKATLEQNGHNEGTITLSNNSGDLTIKDCDFNLSSAAAWGNIGDDDCEIIATNTSFADHPKKYFSGGVPSAACFDDSGVTYINVPD